MKQASIFPSLVERMGGTTKFTRILNRAIDDVWSEVSDTSFKPKRVYPGLVWKWINGRKDLAPPAQYVRPMVCAADWCGIKITDADLRPDVFVNSDDGGAAA